MANQKAISFVTGQLIEKELLLFEFTDLISILSDLPVVEKNRIIGAIKSRRRRDLGNRIDASVRSKIASDAATSAAALLSDDSLSAAEIDRIF